MQKTSKKRRKQTGENIEKRREKRRIWGKSNNHNIHIFDFKLYFARKHNLKKVVFTIKLYLQFLCVAGYLKHSNDTPNLNIHKYTNYDIIEMYINRLSTNFHSDGCQKWCQILDNDVRKVPLFQKKKLTFVRTFFTHPIQVTGSMYWVHVLTPYDFDSYFLKNVSNWQKFYTFKGLTNFRFSAQYPYLLDDIKFYFHLSPIFW